MSQYEDCQAALELLRKNLNRVSDTELGQSLDVLGVTSILAMAEETARLADEQRTANLLEFCKVFAGSIEKIGEKSVRDVLYERLGVADPNTVPF